MSNNSNLSEEISSCYEAKSLFATNLGGLNLRGLYKKSELIKENFPRWLGEKIQSPSGCSTALMYTNKKPGSLRASSINSFFF